MRGSLPRSFHLDPLAGWRSERALDDLVDVTGPDGIRLMHLPGPPRPLVDAAGSFGGLDLPTGLAVDRDGGVIVLDRVASTIKRLDPCTGLFEVIPCVGGRGDGPRELRDPRGIAVSCRGDLFVADTGNRRVQVFALKGGSLRAVIGPLRAVAQEGGWRVERIAPVRVLPDADPGCGSVESFPEGTWEPWDVVISERLVTYVSDRANGLIHVFGPSGRWMTAFTGEGPDSPPLHDPTDLALDADGRLYVVQAGEDFVTVLDPIGGFVERVDAPGDLTGRFCPVAVAVDEQGNLCVSDRMTRRVYLYRRSPEGRCRSAGALGFVGIGDDLAFDSAGNPLVADGSARCLVRMDAGAAFEPMGRLYTQPLDSEIYRCQWHRVSLVASIPRGTAVRVDTFTSEAPKTAAEMAALPESRWTTGQTDAIVRDGDAGWDCLITSPPGRYLWLRLTLTGDGTSSPVVRRLRIEYPRDSSLRHLPANYQEDAESAEFLGRFLSIFDTIRDGFASRVASIAAYFDPAATPASAAGLGEDFLSWLASWLGLSLDARMPVARRRLMVEGAHRLYALRGTPEGVREHIELCTGRKARILEHYKLRRWSFVGSDRLGDRTAVWGPDVVRRLHLDEFARIGEFQLIDSGDPLSDPFGEAAHRFTVFVTADPRDPSDLRSTVERVVELARPAHTEGNVVLAGPRFRIGVQAFVGIDTVVARYPDRAVEGEVRIGSDAVLGTLWDDVGPPSLRIGAGTRLGSGAALD